MEKGADAIYSSLSPYLIFSMTREKIPVIGHVGYVPYRKSWYGKARAVGKTVDEAMWVYRQTLEFQDAGAIGVEMEIVPNAIADEIAKRVDILILSMGSGTGGDVQFLFSTDLLGTNTCHTTQKCMLISMVNCNASSKYESMHLKLLKMMLPVEFILKQSI